MTSFTWLNGVTGDWSDASLWTEGVVPDSDEALASIAAPGTYTVEIPTDDTETVNQLDLNPDSATLSVDGTLQFAGALAAAVVQSDGAVVVGTSGVIEGTGLFAPGGMANYGTLIANGGSNSLLEVLSTVTNYATVLADNGDLEIGGVANLANSALTGGTYIASGFIPVGADSAADNILALGLGANAGLAVDAATIVLDGPAALLEVYDNDGNWFTLEQQLQTIAAGGVLAVLDGRGFVTTDPLLDNGNLVLGGNTLATGGLTIGSGGALIGYGAVVGPVDNSGAIVANGGTLGSLALDSAVSGGGTLWVQEGSTLLLSGGVAAGMNVDGALYDSGTLDAVGAVSGTGTVIVQHGGALELGGAAATALSFAGDDVTVTLDAPSQYSGTLIGFGQGDTLVLSGLAGSAASVVNGDTLAVSTAAGSTVDSLTLAGDDTGATFSAVTVGDNTVVTNTAGAPVRDDMPITLVSVTNAIGLAGSLVTEIENEVTYAAENWGQYITGATPLRVSLSFIDSGDFGGEIALGSPGGFVSNGETIDGHPVYIPDSLYALQTGDYATGFSSDIAITLVASAVNLSNLYINTDPAVSTAVPAGEIDLLSVLTHEFAHGLGFFGLIDRADPVAGSPPVAAGAPIGIYDSFVSDTTVDGTAVATFDGANAAAAYGAAINAGSAVPVPLYLTSDGDLDVENFYHLSGTDNALSDDLMEAALPTGTYLPISNIDLGMLQDTGVPVTASVTCYVKGTRIRTPQGDVAIERLQPGESVITGRGVERPIVRIGYRRIDCRQHPRAERVQPVRVAAHGFGPGLPSRDLFVSPNHAIYFAEVLIPVRLLIDGILVTRADFSSVEYYHIELPTHDIILAEGLPAESYLDCGDGPGFAGDAFASQAGDMRFPGNLAGDLWECAGCAPLKLCGPELAAARAQLHARGLLLGLYAGPVFGQAAGEARSEACF